MAAAESKVATKKSAAKPVKKPIHRASSATQKGKVSKASKVGEAVHGSVEIFAGTAKGRTGAQSIAPDHSPRKAHAVAPRATLKAIAPADLHAQVAQFLYEQSERLDAQDWAGFIEMFDDDGVYWMPVLPEQTEWEGSPSIFAEDKLMMQVRMGRVTHPNAWSQAPLWGTNHVIGNIVLESVSAREIVVRSRFHMMELRRDAVRHFGGTYRHTLRRSAKGLKIKLQRVDLFNGQAPFDYVLQVWV